MNQELPYGIYDSLIDTSLQKILSRYPALRSVLGKIDPEEQPDRYAEFVARVVQQVLREEPNSDKRQKICNALLAKVSWDLCYPMPVEIFERNRVEG